jgi:hypothetical protein
LIAGNLPAVLLESGDPMEIEIDGIGNLANPAV